MATLRLLAAGASAIGTGALTSYYLLTPDQPVSTSSTCMTWQIESTFGGTRPADKQVVLEG